MPISIMLDAGHGGFDPGAVYNGRQEKDDALNLVLLLGEILQQRGFDVEYTRTTDIYESPFEKAMEANAAGVDYFISIHRNSFPTPNTAEGVESLVFNKSGIKYELAENINARLENIGFENLGVKERPNLVVLKRTRMPSVLVEVGFINSDSDNMLFDKNFEAIAAAIADGISDTLGSSTSMQSMTYEIQVGAFRNELYANRLLQELLRQDYPARIEDSDGYYRVRIGMFHNLDDATQMEQQLRRSGYQTLVLSAE
ncbi:MAG: N-acetylmuramoyl-L-alanine amidase [Hespellia sp.]|nr:N-acetylmuramoyl-L-alanine amidase [Hespellia sp.]